MSEKTTFGFKEVLKAQKKGLVNEVFSSVASKYDIMNDLMSVGLHRIWKKTVLDEITDPSGALLDMASGSGDIAINFYKKCRDQYGILPNITACDANADMLEVGRAKALDQAIRDIKYHVSFAEELPFKDNSFDYYLVSFGIRNFTDINAALKEALRVLKPGGKFICLEFSKINEGLISKLYEAYSMNIIPKIGKIVADDEDSYKYLVESIRKFPSREEFKTIIEKAGFSNAKYYNMTFDVVAIHTGFKNSK
jgi:ubiquinone/menaquinone biosynthesis methyltransferase